MNPIDIILDGLKKAESKLNETKPGYSQALKDLIEENSHKAEQYKRLVEQGSDNVFHWRDRGYYLGLCQGLNIALVLWDQRKGDKDAKRT